MASGQVMTGHGRDERVRAGRQDQRVVGQALSRVECDCPRGAVDRGDAHAGADTHAGVGGVARVVQVQRGAVPLADVARQSHPVVGGVGLVADHRDVHVRIGVACAEGGDETVGDHPVSDDDDVLAHVRVLLRSCADQARKTVLRRCGGRSRGRDVPFTARRSRGEGPGVRGPVAAGSGERRLPSACW